MQQTVDEGADAPSGFRRRERRQKRELWENNVAQRGRAILRVGKARRNVTPRIMVDKIHNAANDGRRLLLQVKKALSALFDEADDRGVRTRHDPAMANAQEHAIVADDPREA